MPGFPGVVSGLADASIAHLEELRQSDHLYPRTNGAFIGDPSFRPARTRGIGPGLVQVNSYATGLSVSSGDQDATALDFAVLQVVQGAVGLG